MIQISIRNSRLHRGAAVLSLGSALLLAACASTPPEPTVALKAADQAIVAADRTRVAYVRRRTDEYPQFRT